jgi:U3 small nucleolar RNA-associated protein 4
MSLVLAPAALASNTVVKIANPLATSVEASFEDAYHRRVAYTQEGRVRVSSGARLISSAGEAGLTVWRIFRGSKPSTDDVLDGAQDLDQGLASDWEKVLEMDLNVHSNIIVHEISEDGSWLAISDCYETKLFRLHTTVSHLRGPMEFFFLF